MWAREAAGRGGCAATHDFVHDAAQLIADARDAVGVVAGDEHGGEHAGCAVEGGVLQRELGPRPVLGDCVARWAVSGWQVL